MRKLYPLCVLCEERAGEEIERRNREIQTILLQAQPLQCVDGEYKA